MFSRVKTSKYNCAYIYKFDLFLKEIKDIKYQYVFRTDRNGCQSVHLDMNNIFVLCIFVWIDTSQ